MLGEQQPQPVRYGVREMSEQLLRRWWASAWRRELEGSERTTAVPEEVILARGSKYGGEIENC